MGSRCWRAHCNRTVPSSSFGGGMSGGRGGRSHEQRVPQRKGRSRLGGRGAVHALLRLSRELRRGWRDAAAPPNFPLAPPSHGQASRALCWLVRGCEIDPAPRKANSIGVTAAAAALLCRPCALRASIGPHPCLALGCLCSVRIKWLQCRIPQCGVGEQRHSYHKACWEACRGFRVQYRMMPLPGIGKGGSR